MLSATLSLPAWITQQVDQAMALSLSPEPSDRPSEKATALQMRVPQANVVELPAAEPELPPVVLCVPEVGTTASIVQPGKAWSAPEESAVAADVGHDEPLSAAASPVSQLAEAWQSIDWTKVSGWVTRPVVTYSAAALVAVVVIAVIAGRSPAPAPPDAPQLPAVADEQSNSPPREHQFSEHAAAPDAPNAMQQPRPRDEIVKLPRAPKHDRITLPWRHDSAADFSPHQDVTTHSPLPKSATARDATVRLPPIAPTDTSSERPNVARLEGRIRTPKLPR